MIVIFCPKRKQASQSAKVSVTFGTEGRKLMKSGVVAVMVLNEEVLVVLIREKKVQSSPVVRIMLVVVIMAVVLKVMIMLRIQTLVFENMNR